MFKINICFILLISVFLGACNYQGYQNNGGIFESESNDVIEQQGENGTDNTGLGLQVPNDFTVSIFADNLPGARDLTGPDLQGNYWLSRTNKGVITLLETKNGKVIASHDILRELNNPHGIILDYEDYSTLYYAETDKISKIRLYSDAAPEKVIDLPSGGRHYTRSLAWGADGKIYVSIGSTCDVCYEEDERIGTIYRMNKDGSELEKFATGLRNSVFMNIDPISGELWATEMGRDHLGDDLPPDEINIIKQGNDYGWPICYGKNMHDTDFDKNTYIMNPCQLKTPSHIDLQAHSAPLGLAFVPEEGWPEEYWNDLLVAYHGSWNRSEPTGYKIMHIKLDDLGNVEEKNDFVSGWLQENGKVTGRPVDILTFPGGIAYITDDFRGVVYKITYNSQ